MIKECDVVVVGAGNAALTAAISAAENGARVLVLEKAPQAESGGDTRFTDGSFKFTYDSDKEIFELIHEATKEERETAVIEPYSKGDFYRDLMEVTRGRADPEIAELIVNKSNETVWWMRDLGVEWELYTDFAVRSGGKLYFTIATPVRTRGGGKALTEMEIKIAEKKGVEILYNTKAKKLLVDEKGGVTGVKALRKEGSIEISSGATILACGGFQANVEMRTKYLGPGWDVAKVRGTKYNTGDGLKMALEIGTQPAGQWSGCHCPIIDANAPGYESGVESSRYSYPYSVVINENGKRFLDEGANYWPKTYAKYGKIVMRQPGSISYEVFDSKVEYLLPAYYEQYMPLVRANSIEELADKLGINPRALRETVVEFNRAVRSGEFNPGILDAKRTEGIEPPKSNWAQTIDAPPFIACPVTGGITFTFGGIKINRKVQVLNTEGEVIKNLYAAGEIVGGIFYYNYLGGVGLMQGAVLGRIAGANAAEGI